MSGKIMPAITIIGLIGLTGCKDTNVTCTSPGAKQRLTTAVEKFFKKTEMIGATSNLTFSDFQTLDIDSVHSDCAVLASGTTTEGDRRVVYLQYMVRNEPELPEMVVNPNFGSLEIKKD